MSRRLLVLVCLSVSSLVLLQPRLGLADPDFVPDWSATGTVGDGWGDAVCTAGDINGDGHSDVLVGAKDFTGGQIGEGIVYLYYGSESGLENAPSWAYASNVQFAQFGWSVAPAGDTNGDGYGDFLVGAPGVSAGHSEEGRVYLFAGGPGDPTLLQFFEINEEDARLGHCVAWAGDVNGDGYDDVMMGAPEWGGYGSPFHIPVQGAAQVHHGGPGGPDQSADWSPRGGQTAGRFGYSVAGVGDVNGDGFADVVVGQPKYDPGILDNNYGKALCYLGSASGLSNSPAWELIGQGAEDELGTCVAYAGDNDGDGYADVLVGAPDYSPGQGAFYWCPGSAAGLGGTTRYLGNYGDFGSTLSTIGDFDGDGLADFIAGGGIGDRAHIYYGTLFSPALEAVETGSGLFAETVAGAGDVDGDGTGGFLITEPLAGNGAGWLGHYEGDHVIESQPAVLRSVEGATPDGELGRSVASAGDVDGDGDDEVLVGVPGLSQVQLFEGHISGIAPNPEQVIDGSDPSSRLGAAVASAGDVNGDGFADVVIGEPGLDTVHVHLGSSSGLSTSPDWSFTLEESGADFGVAVDGAGDVNADGFADIVVGGPLYDGTRVEQGRVLVFLGSPDGISTEHWYSIKGGQDGMHFGASVAGMGDGHGDGYDDVAVGAPGYDLQWVDQGGLFVYYGAHYSLGGPYGNSGLAAGNRMGASVAAAGDVNGDGLADLVVGEPGYDDGAADTGFARVFLGDDVGVPFLNRYSIHSPSTLGGEQFGLSVATLGDPGGLGRSAVVIASTDGATQQARADAYALDGNSMEMVSTMLTGQDAAEFVVAGAGDVDGDGLPETVIGTPLSRQSEGSFWLFAPHVVESRAVPAILPRAVHAGGEPIALRGQLDPPSELRFSMKGWLPTGRTRVQLEWQLAEERQPYGPPATGPWALSNPQVNGGVEISADPAASLDAGTRCRWRIRVASANPYFPQGRWMTDQSNTDNLYGFRVFDAAVGVEEGSGPGTPARVALLRPPYPNPFNPSTRLEFQMPQRGEVSLKIFDVTGRLVRTIYAGALEAGTAAFSWEGRDDAGQSVASGSYYAVLEVGGERFRQKLTLLK